ncbi:MAG: hypothetical protein LBJ69_02755 [Holosporales bacterium]|jgi:hypothetical protein|nr:hypothetical protein [Holosporales bacterium]
MVVLKDLLGHPAIPERTEGTTTIKAQAPTGLFLYTHQQWLINGAVQLTIEINSIAPTPNYMVTVVEHVIELKQLIDRNPNTIVPKPSETLPAYRARTEEGRAERSDSPANTSDDDQAKQEYMDGQPEPSLRTGRPLSEPDERLEDFEVGLTEALHNLAQRVDGLDGAVASIQNSLEQIQARLDRLAAAPDEGQ